MRHLHCLGRSGRLEEAFELAGHYIQTWEHSPDFFFVLGNLLLDRAVSDPRQAIDTWLPLAGNAWERCLDIGERPDLEGASKVAAAISRSTIFTRSDRNWCCSRGKPQHPPSSQRKLGSHEGGRPLPT